jgi:hypothetical protein
MKNRMVLLPSAALVLAALACNLEQQAAPALSQQQIHTLSAQTLMAIQWQTLSAGGNTPGGGPGATAEIPAITATNTILPSITPTGTLAPSSTFTSTVTNTPVPCNWVQFISDITIPDNWETGPLDHFTKTWRLKNIGSCTWTSGYALVFDHGDQMGAPAAQQLTTGTVAPGGSIDVSVDLLSPASAGTYQGFFKLRASDSSVFGIGAGADGAFWVKIKVDEPTPESTTVVPTVQSVYSQTSISSGMVGHTTAACPSGTLVTGGGYSVSNNGVWAYIQRKNGNGWVVYAQNNNATAQTLIAYAICLTYPPANTIGLNTSINVAGGNTADLTAACPAGSVAVGGGYTGLKEGTLHTYYSALSGNGWRVSERNTGSSTASFSAYVVCLDGASGSTSSATGLIDISPGSNGYAEAVCPAGRVMTSGGWSIDEDLVVYYTSLYSGKWRVYARNIGTHTRAMTVRGTCFAWNII